MTDRVGQQLGNYQLIKLLGRGGCAEVYLGKHHYLNTYAALKVLNVRIPPGEEHRYLVEAQTLVDLRHPNIVHLLDFFIENQHPILIMYYASKGSLRQSYPQGTQIPLTTVVEFVAQIATALQYAHNHSIIHRDVKPENILLDRDNQLLLSDFGLSLLTQSSEELSTQDPVGTARYMAPEQLRGKPCFASDQYALAIMVYEWLCGDPPFRGTMWEIWHQHLYAAPPSLHSLRPESPLVLEQVVQRALAKKPQDRFVSIQAFAQALARAKQTYTTSADENTSQVTVPIQPITAAHRIAAALPPQRTQIATRVQALALPQHTPVSTLPQQNRTRLLQRVRSFWITGVLEQSLYGAALLALGLQEQPDAVANPWRLTIQESEQAKGTPLPAGTRITEVYDDAGGELLILGEPGAGKTTLLLELARDLLDRAVQEPVHLIPVVFNLSSWAQKRQALTAWLIEELETKYQVPKKVASDWINADQILPLLDGLDEVDAASRTACMQTINEYHQAHSLVPLVVCCRVNEYMSQENRLALFRAVTIQPLTTEQINEYFARIGEQAASLRMAFQNDQVLQELATTPLMLTILILAYQGSSLEEIQGDASAEARKPQIFATYTQRMFQRRSVETRYTPKQTKYWLTWLAKRMTERNQTQFYIERLQVDWLSKSRQGQLYTCVACGLICLLIFTYVDWMLYTNFLDGLLIGLLDTIVFILLNGPLFAWFAERVVHLATPFLTMKRGSSVSSRKEQRNKGSPRLITLFTQILENRIGYGLLSGLLDGIFVGFLIKNYANGLINGTIYGLCFVFLGKLDKKIQPTEVMIWSWTGVRRNAIKSLIAGLSIGFLSTDFRHLSNLSTFLPSLPFGLSNGLVIGLAVMLFFGFSRDMLDAHNVMKPNQGIWNSFSNGTRLALLFGLPSGLIFFLSYSFAISRVFKVGYAASLVPNSGLTYGMIDGLILAGMIWLLNGGLACIQHFVLRVLLWQTGCTPWNYPRFLDYASERILLRKVGGGYIFVHRLLLEYFASLEPRLSAT